jgi:hypothetical protein
MISLILLNHAFTFSGSGLVYQWRARASQGIDTAFFVLNNISEAEDLLFNKN